MDSKLILEKEGYAILGACFEVYKQKGCGFVEQVFQECLQIELGLRNIPFQAQVQIQISYKGQALKQKYIAELLCFDKVLVEIKAVSTLVDEHRAQLMNYLKATGLKVGLLVNFGHYPLIQHERIVF